MTVRTFLIPAQHQAQVEAAIIKLNRKAIKNNFPQVKITWQKAFQTNREVLWQDLEHPEFPPKFVTRDVLVVPVDITGLETLVFAGWQFIAQLETLKTDSGKTENIIRSLSDIPIPEQFKTSGSVCEHCQVNRYRKTTFILKHENGQFVQVGSTCLKDFIGGHFVDGIFQRAEFLAEFCGQLENVWEMPVNTNNSINYLPTFLANTAAVIENYGWRSKKSAEETGAIATAELMKFQLKNIDEKLIEFRVVPVTETHQDKAISTLEWIENLSDEQVNLNEYLYNLRVIARSGLVHKRLYGFAASMIPAYDRELSRLGESDKQSEYFGKTGEKVVIEVTLKRCLTFESSYGTIRRYIFEDDAGNVFTWKASSRQDINEGQKYTLKTTIKGHVEYRMVKQTEITRAKVLEQK